MAELDDQQLLRDFAGTRSEAAFDTLVTRYVNLVYSTALRFAGDPRLAEEITQAVFILLARKAGDLRRGTVLSGWLYQTARLTAANVRKGEIRRQRREQEACMQSILNEPDAAAWEDIAPMLDDAMGRLGQTDRNAIVLRFFENKTGREVAATLKLTEAAAHKRVNRALDKLRGFFTKRGITSTSAIIAGAILTHSVHTAPMALAKTVTAVALAKGAAAPISTLSLIKGTLKIMAWTKMKTAAVAAAAILLAAGTTTTWIIHHESTPKPRPVDSSQTAFPRNTWRFAGYGTPESAAMSTCWALGNNDGRTFRNSMSPALQQPFAGKPDSAVINDQNRSDFAKITGYRILDKQVLSETEVVLNCYAEGLNDSQKFLFLRVGDEWKYNGEPKD